MWVKFSQRKPKLGGYLITRAPSCNKDDNFFDDHKDWDETWLHFPLKPAPVSHWWNGEPNFELAIKSWDKLDGEIA